MITLKKVKEVSKIARNLSIRTYPLESKVKGNDVTPVQRCGMEDHGHQPGFFKLDKQKKECIYSTPFAILITYLFNFVIRPSIEGFTSPFDLIYFTNASISTISTTLFWPSYNVV